MIYLPAAKQWRVPELSGLLVPLGAGVMALVVIGLLQIGLPFIAAGLVLLVLAAVLAIRHPIATAIFMVAFASVNRFLIMVVYHYSGSIQLTKAIELWKEGVLAVLVLRVLYDLLFTPERSHTVKILDITVLFFIAVSAVYVLYPGPLGVDLFTRLQGFRTDTVFMFAYWIGRGLHIHRRELRWLLLAMVGGSILTAAVAIAQFADSTSANQVFNNLGFQEFSILQTGASGPGAIRARDLPGAAILPRATSLQLSDLALAFYQLLAVAMASSMYALSKRRVQRIATGIFLAAMIATLALTATRSAIASAIGGVVATALVSRKLVRFGVFALALAAFCIFVIEYGPVTGDSFLALANFQDPSSQQHQALLGQSVEAVRQDPLGRGLGTAGLVAQNQLRGGQSITNESWYLQLGTEMGVLGMIAYLLVLGSVLGIALWSFWRVHDFWLRVLTLTVAGTAGTMLVAGNFLHSWENTPLSMVFWLYAGLAVRARDLAQSPSYLEKP